MRTFILCALVISAAAVCVRTDNATVAPVCRSYVSDYYWKMTSDALEVQLAFAASKYAQGSFAVGCYLQFMCAISYPRCDDHNGPYKICYSSCVKCVYYGGSVCRLPMIEHDKAAPCIVLASSASAANIYNDPGVVMLAILALIAFWT